MPLYVHRFCPTTCFLCIFSYPESLVQSPPYHLSPMTASINSCRHLCCITRAALCCHLGLQACSVAVCAPIKLGLAAPRRQGSYLCVCVLTKCSALFYIHICGHIYVGEFCYGGAVPLVFRYARYAPHSAYLTYLYLGCVSIGCTFTTGIWGMAIPVVGRTLVFSIQAIPLPLKTTAWLYHGVEVYTV